jgi:Bacterial sugar transferase
VVLTRVPWLTGLPQVHVEGVWDVRGTLRLDLAYVRPMSLVLDVKLMLLSVRNRLLARWNEEGRIPTKNIPESGKEQTGRRLPPNEKMGVEWQ